MDNNNDNTPANNVQNAGQAILHALQNEKTQPRLDENGNLISTGMPPMSRRNLNAPGIGFNEEDEQANQQAAAPAPGNN